MRTSVAREEAGYKFLHRITVFNFVAFAVVVVLRDHHIARIAHNVHRPRIARLETLVAFDNAGMRHPVEIALESNVWIRDQPVNAGEVDTFIRKSEVSDKKPSPRVARLRKGNKENIV